MARYMNREKTMNNKLSSILMASTLFAFSLGQTHAAVPIVQGSLSGNSIISNNISNPAADQTADTQGSTLWKLYQQVQQLQQEVRELRGQLEAQQNGLDRTQKDLKNRYTDLDQRLELLREKSEDSNTEEVPSEETNTDSDASKDNTATPPNVAPSKNLDANPISTPNQPKPPINPLSSPTPSASNGYVQQSNDADKQAYIGAYDAYKAGGATKAIKPMQQFIVNFPNSAYVPNAYYWLGEFHLASNPADFTKAKKSFNEVVNKYPKSAKASTALYRIATISQEIDKRPQEALSLMQKLSKDYPNSAEAQYAKSFIATYAKKP